MIDNIEKGCDTMELVLLLLMVLLSGSGFMISDSRLADM